ncbi:hypothetical protein [Gracilibacillus salinarum]|uniref:Uncharacterized protein n=1 Tax=Gracilibacillus salinarum TaxID=2932255 RepID=A0ABY4GLK1_9BACI|nr:hypothetical protein [Gracilibacillus salinarum]UOQ85083.1 hypothetical protein MUN87_20960 [Gracilibacillus salinarum]
MSCVVEGRILRKVHDSFAIYITIAVSITLLIGIGWFVLSYYQGKTVFNQNAIKEYPYHLHETKLISSSSQISVTEMNTDRIEESEEEEELESEEPSEDAEELDQEEIEQENSYYNNSYSTDESIRQDVYGN